MKDVHYGHPSSAHPYEKESLQLIELEASNILGWQCVSLLARSHPCAQALRVILQLDQMPQHIRLPTNVFLPTPPLHRASAA